MGLITRRDFLKGCVKTGLAVGCSGLLGGCQGSPEVPVIPSTPTDLSAKVAAIMGGDLRQMACEALLAFGGAQAIVSPGETVFIKSNFCAAGLVRHDPVQSGDSTKPEIVLAVAEECLKAGAGRVIVGDAAQLPSYSWEALRTLDQTTDMLTESKRLNDLYDGRFLLACLNADSPDWIPVVSPWTGLGEIYISSYVAQADKVISLAVAKTHRWTQITGAMKNFVGVTPVARYGAFEWRYKLHNAAGGIEQCFLDLVSAIKPVFSMIDLSVCCEGNGPHVMPGYWGTTVDVRDRLGQWMILAGTDPVAVDATAARVIGQDPLAVRHLQTAYNMGLGQLKPELIEIIGDDIKGLSADFLPADPTDGFWDILWPGIMMKTQG